MFILSTGDRRKDRQRVAIAHCLLWTRMLFVNGKERAALKTFEHGILALDLGESARDISRSADFTRQFAHARRFAARAKQKNRDAHQAFAHQLGLKTFISPLEVHAENAALPSGNYRRS